MMDMKLPKVEEVEKRKIPMMTMRIPQLDSMMYTEKLKSNSAPRVDLPCVKP